MNRIRIDELNGKHDLSELVNSLSVDEWDARVEAILHDKHIQ